MSSVLKSIVFDLILFIFGIILSLFAVVFILLSSPVYFYRFLIGKVIVPYFKDRAGKIVNVAGHFYATDFLNDGSKSFRNSVVLTFILSGNPTPDEVYTAVDQRWIQAKNDSGESKYPELQQYINSWVGYLFWKRDETFHLSNHLKFHEIVESQNNSELFLSALCEKLLNEPFSSKRSPWELHLVQNFKSASLPGNNANIIGLSKPKSVLLLRIHHILGDSRVFLNLIEHLFDSRKKKPTTSSDENCCKNFCKKFCTHVSYPFRIIYALGFTTYLCLKQFAVSHISETGKKRFSQFYGKAPLIPVDKIECVRNTFGVSFTAVVHSAYAVAIGNHLKIVSQKSNEPIPAQVLIGNPVPKHDHPEALRNNYWTVLLEVPVQPDLASLERLKICHRNILKAWNAAIPNLSGLICKLIYAHPTILLGCIERNWFIKTGLSNFIGSESRLALGRHKLLKCDVLAGGVHGITGIAVFVLSYNQNIQISCAAECMSTLELNKLVLDIASEIDSLYKLALETQQSRSVIIM